MTLLLDGKQLSQKIKTQLKDELQTLIAQHVQPPGLAVILVGQDKASQIYVNNKAKACNEVGLYSEVHRLPENTSENDLVELIKKLNEQSTIHGILVQVPLPKHINEDRIAMTIHPYKDVDGFHPYNVGLLYSGKPCPFLPCTPAGSILLMKEYELPIAGKDAVVIGRSNIAGKPAAQLLLQENATVTICHSKTHDLKTKCLQADIIVAAIGKPHFLTADMVKEGAVVIDIGINRLDGKTVGDVDYDHVASKASAITPVPGGTGATTIAMLMKNTIEGFKTYHLNK